MTGPGNLPDDQKVAVLFELLGPMDAGRRTEFNEKLGALLKAYGAKLTYKIQGKQPPGQP